jgi:hypothetical protein
MSKWVPPHKDFWRNRNLPEPVAEYKFHPKRKWRFDFAWDFGVVKVAVEVEGGIWSYGGHVRGSGWMRDAEKYNAGTRMGWEIYRFTPQQMMNEVTAELLRSALICRDNIHETPELLK